MKNFKCDKCDFKGSSARCLSMHDIFMHGDKKKKKYKCDMCKMTTRTEQALLYHRSMKHKEILLEMREIESKALQEQRERSGNQNINQVTKI